MSTRSTRKQPFCWQEKSILRMLRSMYTKSDLVKMKVLYLTITEIDSDFNGKQIKFYTKTIASYSGLSTKWIPAGLKEFEKIGIIQIREIRDDKKRILGRELIFTPEKMVQKPNVTKPTIRKASSGKVLT